MKDTTKWAGVRVARFEVVKLPKEAWPRWRELSDKCMQATNRIWQLWLMWHLENDSPNKQREFLEKFKAWKETKNKKGKPKCEVMAVPNELSNSINRTLGKEFPDVHIRVLTLLRSIETNTIKQRKASNGNLPGWVAILLCRENMPSYTKSVPIPFDIQNSKIIPGRTTRDNYKLEVRLTRLPRDDGKVSPSLLETVELRTYGAKKLRSQAEIIRKCVSGEYKFCGSSIEYRRGKLYALVCWRKPVSEPVALDESKMAFIKPSEKHPWMLRINGRRRRPAGRGELVGLNRRKLLFGRWTRQESYRHAGSANKGHGRPRAIKWMAPMQQFWKNFVKTHNHNMTKDIVDQCVAAGVGTLVYFQPDGPRRDTRFLAATGKVEGRRDATGWDWHQVATQLGYKCEEAGITLKVRKSGGGEQQLAMAGS